MAVWPAVRLRDVGDMRLVGFLVTWYTCARDYRHLVIRPHFGTMAFPTQWLISIYCLIPYIVHDSFVTYAENASDINNPYLL